MAVNTKSGAQRLAEFRARMREQGLKRVELLVPADKAEKFKVAAHALIELIKDD